MEEDKIPELQLFLLSMSISKKEQNCGSFIHHIMAFCVIMKHACFAFVFDKIGVNWRTSKDLLPINCSREALKATYLCPEPF